MFQLQFQSIFLSGGVFTPSYPPLQTVKFVRAAQKFLACFLSAQNSLRNQRLCRFSNQFSVLLAQFSKRGLQNLLLSRSGFNTIT